MTFKFKKLALATSVVLSTFMLQACNDTETAAQQKQEQAAPAPVAKAEKAEMKSLDVKVVYLDRRMLPPGAELNVTLEDVSLADAPAKMITSESMKAEGVPPYAMTLKYDAAKIQDKNRYAVRATIKADGKLVMTSTSHIDPFAADAKQPIEIKVERIAEEAPAAPAVTETVLVGPHWDLMTLAGENVKAGDNGELAFISFNDDKSVHGFSGCNNFQGSFEATTDSVKMGPAASTRKMCAEGVELEQAFLTVLPNFSNFVIVEDVLSMKDSQGKVIATFKAKQK